jgi:hypothetical protein
MFCENCCETENVDGFYFESIFLRPILLINIVGIKSLCVCVPTNRETIVS